jgi:hypothetical protein
MNRQLKPYEYYFVSNSIFATGEEYFRYIIQDFCLNGTLQLYLEWIELHPSENRLRLRPFIGIGRNYHSYTTNSLAEQFVLELFKNEPPLRIHQIRDKFKAQLNYNVETFKRDFIKKDLKHNGLSFFLSVPTIDGFRLKKEITSTLKLIEHTVENLVEDKINDLILLLISLGSNIVFLSKETIEKIKTIDKNLEEITSIETFGQMDTVFSGYSNIGLLSYFDSFETFDSSFDSGFDFGGGDFGGGGGGDSW